MIRIQELKNKLLAIGSAAILTGCSSIQGGITNFAIGSFNRSMLIGERSGVRLAHVMYAISAQAAGDEQRFRDATKRWARSQNFKPSKPYRLVEDISTLTMTNLSDRYWSANIGTRTPIASIGDYWDESQPAVQGIDLDDLLK